MPMHRHSNLKKGVVTYTRSGAVTDTTMNQSLLAATPRDDLGDAIQTSSEMSTMQSTPPHIDTLNNVVDMCCHANALYTTRCQPISLTSVFVHVCASGLMSQSSLETKCKELFN